MAVTTPDEGYRNAIWSEAEFVTLAPREPFLLETQPDGSLRQVKVTSPAQYLKPTQDRDLDALFEAKPVSRLG